MITLSDARTLVSRAFLNEIITARETDKRGRALIEFMDDQTMLAYWLDDLGTGATSRNSWTR